MKLSVSPSSTIKRIHSCVDWTRKGIGICVFPYPGFHGRVEITWERVNILLSDRFSFALQSGQRRFNPELEVVLGGLLGGA
jgi:hypothetical protein